jgi:putative adenylate-forming enzyme
MIVIQKEYLDKDLGKFIPIITDFSRTTQPIIRYRLNDILTEKKEPCPCGSVFTAIEKIEGRCDDIFYLPAIEGEKFIPVFPDFICRAVIYSSPEIEEYMAIQNNFDLIEILLKSSCEDKNLLTNLVQKSLTEVLEKLNCKIPAIKCNYDYDKLENPRDKKLKRVKRIFTIEGE